MEKYSYTPKGVCSRQFNFEIEDGIIKVLRPLVDAMEI